ncbi:hypothetical protein M3G03_12625 [Aestuariimicrobium sp. p3-SID1156]|uniref:hypothetical protein n=1 Tax=Aestuariimicrobium sp. p3-SID1156 TaxID=2916038 RepID=UPI00223AAD61|nr:hypothetical protein [Aestuariimicrobium sp. p3-SID1156]MCT1460374.1 hypothetical protein [Aestuariimicrobium sp. p3-SID1156]
MPQLAEDAQRPVGLLALEEHHTDPPRQRGLRDGRVGVPGDPPGGDEPFREPVVRPVDEVRGLPQFLRSSERIARSCPVTPGVVEGVRGLVLVNIGDLVERLPQRAHPRGQITDHSVHVGGLIEPPACVGRPPQCLGCLGGVGSRIEERGHHGPPGTSCVLEVRRTPTRLSAVTNTLEVRS